MSKRTQKMKIRIEQNDHEILSLILNRNQRIIINFIAKDMKDQVVILFLLIALIHSQVYGRYSTSYLPVWGPILDKVPVSTDKGMTFHSTATPASGNNFVQEFSCSGCDPYNGDTSCSTSLPLLCIVNPKSIPRTFYSFQDHYTSSAYDDGGYYNGWTGGIFVVTEPIIGISIDTYEAGDSMCKQRFGSNTKFAQFHDGFYMNYMNQSPIKTWNTWSWDQAVPGGWNIWGLSNTNQTGKVWVWINDQPYGNCNNY